MAAVKKKKKHRAKHPGVVIIPPDVKKRTGYRYRYTDPDTGKVHKPAFPDDVTEETQRAKFCQNKSEELAARKQALAKGAQAKRGLTLVVALEHYFDTHKPSAEFSERSYVINRTAADKLTAWCHRHGLRMADDLTKRHLKEFRAFLKEERKRVPMRGKGNRGKFMATKDPRSAAAINQDLSGIHAVMEYCRDSDLFGQITKDSLGALKRMKKESEKKIPLTPEECRRMLRAAVAHDSQCYRATRAEQRGIGQKGDTPRYVAIAPFVLFVLLTGMRRFEALLLDWEWIRLDALDDHGNPSGLIHVPKEVTKTRRGRDVGLEVSSTLRPLLLALGGPDRPRKGSVWGYTLQEVTNALERIRTGSWAPEAHRRAAAAAAVDKTWQDLRVTCACYLVNSPGIFGGANAPFRESRQLGHSVEEAEESYLSVVRGISPEARTLEAAIGIEAQARDVVSHAEPSGVAADAPCLRLVASR